MLRCALFLFVSCLFPLIGAAQTYPEYNSTTLNDFAGIMVDPDARGALTDQLTALRKDTGIEMTVVTLPSQIPFAPDMEMEAFATGLFNHWGVGDADRNDGILVLVLRDDRAMRIELGAAFGRDWDRAAQTVVDRDFLPHFRNADYQAGIVAGTQAVIDRIARPFAHGAPVLDNSQDNNAPWFLIPLLGAVLVLVGFGRKISDFFMRLRKCPKCGRTGTLRAKRRTINMATTRMSGQAERTVWCTACDHNAVHYYIIPQRTEASNSSGGSFGGGSSGGGGASGRW
ncbi:MAG: TPM domain-containing protein [Pseudomonadota bacterium]